ncbi:MAG: DUF1508 domain-containing protein [Clostridia bacterium]|nr:DUF1508 domain-containing protein [Clostridia bacterium]
MGLFKRKEKKKEQKVVQEPITTEQPATAAPEGPSIKNVKVPTEAQQTVTEKPAPAVKPAVPTKPAAPAKPASPAKAPAAKPSANTSKPTAASAARPFFMTTTDDDIRIAFDQAIAEADAEILKSEQKVYGKYEFELEVDGYHFYLIANNGQVLFDSPSFTTLLGALNGIKTFKKTVSEGKFDVKTDKYNRFRFILARKYYGENYGTKDQCLKCIESVKKFACNAKIIRYVPDKQALAAYEAAKLSKRTPDDIDWKAVERAEAQAQKMGKFEICIEEGKQYCFYLTANNGQILYSSRYYANEKACRDGIESFKRAAYVGNFFVDRDKFGNYRYVLKNIGSAPSFIGESYDNKPQCEKIIESVKKFIISATIEMEAPQS